MTKGSSVLPDSRQLLLPVVLVALVLGTPYLLRPIAQVLMAFFAAILLAVFLDALISLVKKIVPVPRKLALALVLLAIIAVLVGFSWFAGGRIAEQASELTQQVPEAASQIEERLREERWLQELIPQGDGQMLPDLLKRVTQVFQVTLGIIGLATIILFAGLFMAINPRLYTGALLILLPPKYRKRGGEVLEKLGHVMRWWLVGRVISMAIVGGLTAAGLLAIGEPLGLIIGVIAGLLSFIPFLGPVLAAVPALLVGLARSPTMALWVLFIFLGVQAVESNLITPLIERRVVMIPPAFIILAQFMLAVLLGFFGILLATPLIVLVTVLVQMLYIQDVLKDEVQVLGQHGD